MDDNNEFISDEMMEALAIMMFEEAIIYEDDEAEYEPNDFDYLEYDEEDDYASNMDCDTWGFCSGSSCPNYWKCGGR
jgi:hypothetical protein